MTAGEIRKALEGVSDQAKVRIEGEAWITDVTSGWLNITTHPKSVKIRGETLVILRGDFEFPSLR